MIRFDGEFFLRFIRFSLSLLPLITILLYLVPLLVWLSYLALMLPLRQTWFSFVSGLLLVSIFVPLWLVFLRYWEEEIRSQERAREVGTVAPTSQQDSPLVLFEGAWHQENETLKRKAEQVHNLTEERENLASKLQEALRDFTDYKTFAEEQLKQKQLQLASAQESLLRQQEENEQRRQQIDQLNHKIQDLGYEIKVLLDITPPSAGGGIGSGRKTVPLPLPPSQEERMDPRKEKAMEFLRYGLSVAQKIAGRSSSLSDAGNRYREFTPPYYSIDQRRLFDGLRIETDMILLLYHPGEQNLLFAHGGGIQPLHVTPEEFCSLFFEMMSDRGDTWKKSVASLTEHPFASGSFFLTGRDVGKKRVAFLLNVIPMGLFRHEVFGVLYEPEPL